MCKPLCFTSSERNQCLDQNFIFIYSSYLHFRLSILIPMTRSNLFATLFTLVLVTFVTAQTPVLGTYRCIQNDNASAWTLELADSTFEFGGLEGDWHTISEAQLLNSGIEADALASVDSAFVLNVNGELRAFGISRDSTIFLQTIEDLSLTCDASGVAQTPQNPLTTPPTTQPVSNPTPEQLAAQGIDPETMLIPDVFHCYQERPGDDFSQYDFDLTILPGNRYSTPFGDGDYSLEVDSLIEVTWLSGPLASENSYGFASYGDYGQDISLYEIGVDELDFNCYQQGPRVEQIKLELAFKNAQPGSYTCVEEDTSNPGPRLEILGAHRYRVDGAEGEFAVDLMNDPEDDLPSIDYLSGPWADGYGFISSNEETGLRDISVSTDNGDFDCSMLGAPLQSIRYGTATAAPPPAGAGGLEGLYAMWQPDTLGYCGGLCWSFYYFFPNGYVYTEEPDTPLEEIDCTRTHPNGTALCDVYTLEGDSIYFRDGERKSFVQRADGLELDGGTYTKILPVENIRLDGEFKAFSYTAAVGGQGGTAIEKKITFRPDGTFTRDGFVGASFTATDTGTQFGSPTAGVTVSSESSNSGTYQLQGNTLTLNFNDGQTSKEFFFIMPGEDPTKPEGFHMGGWDFILE
jgi:hypothetical protein